MGPCSYTMSALNYCTQTPKLYQALHWKIICLILSMFNVGQEMVTNASTLFQFDHIRWKNHKLNHHMALRNLTVERSSLSSRQLNAVKLISMKLLGEQLITPFFNIIRIKWSFLLLKWHHLKSFKQNLQWRQYSFQPHENLWIKLWN